MAIERLLLPFALILLFFFCDITRCRNLTKDDSGKSQGISRGLMYNPIVLFPVDNYLVYILLLFTVCNGGHNNTDKIVGGCDVKKGELPWVIGIWRTKGSRPFCGGSIVGKR